MESGNLEILQGDLEELYHERVADRGRLAAKVLLMVDILGLCLYELKMRNRSKLGMYKNLLKVIFRNLIRRKLFTSINLFGLSFSLIIGLVIMTYVSHELSYDRYHKKSERIFRVTQENKGPQGYHQHWARVSNDFINDLPQVFPEIESLVRVQSFRPRNVIVNDQVFREKHAFAVDKEIFQLFDYQMLYGNPKSALSKPNSVVLTQTTALKYFGSPDVIGKEIKTQGHDGDMERYLVTGVIEDIPSNSHLPITLLTSIKKSEDRVGWAYIYLLLNNSDPQSIQNGLQTFTSEKASFSTDDRLSFHLQPLEDIHLKSHLAREITTNGQYDYIVIFSIVALFILIIAGINFANLNIVQTLDRLREVGVRKVLGGNKRHLSNYFFLETMIMVFFSTLLATISFYFLLPTFESFLGYSLVFQWSFIFTSVVLVACILGLLSGAYPAQVLSRSAPLSALKNHHSQGPSGTRSRQLLLGIQFSFTICLISAMVITQKQFTYMQEKNLGYNRDHILAIKKIPDLAIRQAETFKSELKSIRGVKDVSATLELPSAAVRDGAGILVSGKNTVIEDAPVTDLLVVDLNIDTFMEMELLAGTGLPKHLKIRPPLPEIGVGFQEITQYVSSQKRAYLINETAMKLMGWQDPEDILGVEISLQNPAFALKEGPIVGVIKDYHQESLKAKIDPVVMIYEPVWLHHLLIKTDGNQIQNTMAEIEEQWEKYYSDFPMELVFLDDEFDRLYSNEEKQLTLITSFSVLAIIIAFLGLFGLVGYSLKRRMKEMAIRKVLGASLKSITWLLSKEYTRIVIVSACLSIPVVWVIMNNWLENYAYHINMHGISFFLAFLGVAIVLSSTLLFQVWISGTKNPTDVLKTD